VASLLLLAAVEIVSAGQARRKIESDGSKPARFATDLIQRHVVLITGTALPTTGFLPTLRFQRGPRAGYSIEISGENILVSGQDLVRAAYDLLEAWGCRFHPVETPRAKTLSISARQWRPTNELWLDRFDPALPLQGVSVHGLKGYSATTQARAKALGYALRVASTSFDDFLPTRLFKEHPGWFALRNGHRQPRGNFALTNTEARAAYLERLGQWLDSHPEVDVVGIWPEVTRVWCEQSAAIGHPEAYALLWREVAARFPERHFEILATGLTLDAPPGPVPGNIEVRLRPGREASGLQGVAGQPVETTLRAWEARGAKVLLEIDAAPESFCGMPWPCHDAIRANAARLRSAVLLHASPVHARLWHSPQTRRGPAGLLDRAAKLASWGHPRDAADLFFDPAGGIAYRIGTNERLLRIAQKDRDKDATSDVYLGYLGILADLDPRHAKIYRRYRRREVRALVEALLPDGADHEVGPAKVRETLQFVEIQTDLLALKIERRTATVVSLRRMQRGKWSDELTRGAFDVVALRIKSDKVDGAIDLSSPATGRLRIDLRGRLRPGGPRWRSRLDLSSGSPIIRQAAEVQTPGGIAIGFLWPEKRFDRWVCPSHAREGRLGQQAPTLPLPAGALLYVRDGEEGLGVAARLPHGGRAILSGGLLTSVAAGAMQVDWIVFAHRGELGKR